MSELAHLAVGVLGKTQIQTKMGFKLSRCQTKSLKYSYIMSVVLVCFTTISGVWSIVSGVAPISPVVMTKAAFDDNFTCFCYATISLVFLIFYVFLLLFHLFF